MKVLSYNIQCDGSNYSERLVKILKFVKRENPDIISFQEVKYGSYKTILSKLEEYNCYLSNRIGSVVECLSFLTAYIAYMTACCN